MKNSKTNTTLLTGISLIFVLICVVFFINSTSDILTLNIVSFFWPLLFLVGIIFGLFIIRKFKKRDNLFNTFLGIIIICLCTSSLGFYSFIFYLAKALG